MTTLYYQYGDERLYTHPISVDAKEVKMLPLLLDCGVPEDYARSLCETLSFNDVRCTEFSAYYLREYGGPSAREDDSILNFCRKWVTMKAASVIGVKKVVCRKNEEKDGILCVQRFLPSISAFRRYPYRQLYVPLEDCDQYVKEHKIEGGEIERKARYCHDTLYKLSFKEGKSVDKFHRDRAKDKEESNITCFWLYQDTARSKGEYYAEGSQEQKDIARVRGYLYDESSGGVKMSILTTLVRHYKCHIVSESTYSNARIYLEEQWNCLKDVGERLRILTSSLVPEDEIKRLSGKFTKAKHELEHELADEQEDAIMACLRNRLSVISGPGGSGKSTIISALTKIFSEPETAVMAFTNKAVKVLRKNLGEDYPNLSTIHMSMKKRLDGDYSSKSYLRGKKNFIIDEAGQMSCGLFRKLLSAIIKANGEDADYLKRCRIIMLGDHYQCGPIEWGYLFSFLVKHKEQEGRAFSCSILTMDHRTKGRNLGFRKVAAELREGVDAYRIYSMLTKYKGGRTIYAKVKSEDAKTKVGEILRQYRPDKILLSSGKSISTYNLMARNFYNERPRVKRSYRDKNGKSRDCYYAPGDKVKMVENVYATELYKGDEGVVMKVGEDGITCEFDGTEHLFLYEENGEKKERPKLYCKHLDYSYCETIYSSQGSEYNTVLIVADDRIDRDQLYTALTRAKERCIVVDVIGRDGNGKYHHSSAIEYFLPRAWNDKTLDLTFL
jgi:energy-coupling factor transporter ATP-binding protein EcfA2